MPDYELLVDAENNQTTDFLRYRKHAFYWLIVLFAVVLLTANFITYTPEVEESPEIPEPEGESSDEIIRRLKDEKTQPAETVKSAITYNYDDLPPCNLTREVEKPTLNTEAILAQFWRCASMILMRFGRNPQGLVFNWPYTIYVCDEEDEIAKIPVRSFDNGERTFWAVLPKCKEESTFVTLGTGNNSKAQEEVTSLVKNVTKIGTDPYVDSNNGYDNFYKVAVSTNNSVIEEIEFTSDNEATSRNVSSVDQFEFFNQTVAASKIDMLWISHRHGNFEYWNYLKNDGKFDKMGITVCQLNIEITMEDAENWQKLIDPLIAARRFIFMRPMATKGGKLTRTFFLNAKDPECVRKYLQ